MNLAVITTILSYLIYIALALIALWGAYCVIMVWRRVALTRFRSEAQQDAFLDEIEGPLNSGDFDKVVEICEDDARAMPQLVILAVENRTKGFAKVRGLLVERFQRDVLSDLEFRLSWVNTVIKSAPMVGLFGTVAGMMGAFDQLANPAAGGPDPSAMASNISLALVTTACGLAIAIPLVLCVASINVRIRKMEDLIASGTARFLEMFRDVINK